MGWQTRKALSSFLQPSPSTGAAFTWLAPRSCSNHIFALCHGLSTHRRDGCEATTSQIVNSYTDTPMDAKPPWGVLPSWSFCSLRKLQRSTHCHCCRSPYLTFVGTYEKWHILATSFHSIHTKTKRDNLQFCAPWKV